MFVKVRLPSYPEGMRPFLGTLDPALGVFALSISQAKKRAIDFEKASL
jgi:hypothetical protein